MPFFPAPFACGRKRPRIYGVRIVFHRHIHPSRMPLMSEIKSNRTLISFFPSFASFPDESWHDKATAFSSGETMLLFSRRKAC